VTAYKVYVTPTALQEIRQLPGQVRQRAKRAVDGLKANPHPPGSKALDLSDLPMPPEAPHEVWRLRLDRWRIVYAITEESKIIDVLAVRKRPPYDYGDLDRLLRGML
jgi:mRNA interferase RelE/StbE